MRRIINEYSRRLTKIFVLELAVIECGGLILLSTFTVAAQELSGQIKGTVADSSGAAIPKANVIATHTETNTVYRSLTSDDGTFAIPNVRLGRYTIEVEAINFRRTIVRDIKVEVGGVAQLAIALQIGSVNDHVEVLASQAQEIINSTSAELGTVVDDRRVLELPLNGRNAAHLALLQAGVFFERTPDGEGDKLIVHGQRHRSLGITLDGIDTQDNLNRASSVMLDQSLLALPAENVQEFRVITGIASAEFSRGGAQIAAVTRAGTNRFRGSLFEFHRNTIFNANEFFNNSARVERSPLLRHQFGGRIGGPIFRDKTFFFVGYQQTRESKGVSVNRSVYTAEARQGIFRFLDNVQAIPERVAANPGLIRSVNLLQCGPVVQTALSRPCVDSRFNFATPSTPDPFISSQVLGAIPLPNNFTLGDGLNSGGFRFNAAVRTVEHMPSFRLDHKFSEVHSFFGTINYLDRDIKGDFINDREPIYPDLGPLGNRVTHSRGFSGTFTSTFSPTLINEVRAGMVGGENAFLINQPFSTPFNLDLNTITDPYSVGNGLELRDNRTVNVRDTLTWVRANHQIKAGGEFRDRWLDTRTNDLNFPFGDINFNRNDNAPGFTATNLRDLTGGGRVVTTDLNTALDLMNNLVGAIGSVQRRYNVTSLDSGYVPGEPTSGIFQSREFDAFFQDSWRFRPNLTLNLGLRWEFATVPYETRGLVLIPENGFNSVYGISGEDGFFNPGTFNGAPCPTLGTLPLARTTANATSLINACATRYIPGASSTGRPLYNNDFNNFGPVVSVAWDPFKNGKTSVRAGFRISYFQDAFAIIQANVDDNEGLVINPTCIPGSGGCVNNPTLLRDVMNNNLAPVPPVPAFNLPAFRSILDNNAQDFRAYQADLGTPSYQEWTLGVQREVLPNMAIELRYVGNRGRGLRRIADFNEINILARDAVTGATFLDAFLIAQQNLSCNRANPATGGDRFDTLSFSCSRANPLMDALIAGEPGRLRNRTSLLNALDFNAPGEFVYRLTQNETSSPVAGPTDRIRGGSFWGAVLAGRLPVNFFQANPFVASSRSMMNDGFSTFHALEIEVQRRFSKGLSVQANYTFGKALSDFDGDANELLNDTRPSSVRNSRYTTRQIAPRHQFNGNWIWELPFGPGKSFGSQSNGPLKHLIGDWQMGGIISWRSGRPISITSGIGTFHRTAVSAENTVTLSESLSPDQLRNLAKKRNVGDGVFWLDPCLSAIIAGVCQSEGAVSGLFELPRAGQLGELSQTVIYGPQRFSFDFNLSKRMRITEVTDLEFRWEVFNAFNNANFNVPVTDIFNRSFGQVTRTIGDPRLMQFALKINF
ncbi:MAG: TonB-dependent receptor [Acidobacteria bacterium]|nr:TonB-dependent receptor [Acidobacteriota bacterium]